MAVSVKDFGAIGDGRNHPLSARFASLAAAQTVYPFVTSLSQTQDWSGITAALAASQAVHVPAGTYLCGGDEITITRPTRLTGDGPNITVISRNSSGNGIALKMTDTIGQNSYDNCVQGIHLQNTMAGGSPTSGAGIDGHWGYFTIIRDVRITNFFDGIHLVQCPISNLIGLIVTTFRRYGFWSEGNYGFDCRITDFVISGQIVKVVRGIPTLSVLGEAGIRLDDMNDEFLFTNGIVNYCKTGLYTDAGTFSISQCPEFCRFTNISFDSCEVGLDLSKCADIVFNSCFISCRPGTGADIGSRGPTRNIQFIGCTFLNNGGHGVTLHSDAKYTDFTNCKFQCNSVEKAGSAHGAYILAQTTDFTFTCCHFDNEWGVGAQNHGLYISAPSCNRFVIIGNYFGSLSGSRFVNNSTGNDQRVSNNIGYVNQASGSATGRTDAAGDLAVTHGLAAIPRHINVVRTGTTFAVVQPHTKAASTFKLRFFDAAGTPIVGTSVSADWTAGF